MTGTRAWASSTVWWHAYPLGLLGAPRAHAPEVVHRLPGLVPWLDHLVELGCDGLALGPVFASETHGYDTTDPFTVDPRLGTEDDLLSVVRAAHDRGVRVQLDGVFHHVGRSSAPFQDVLARDRDSPYASWFRLRDGVRARDGGYADFEGHRHLVALDHGSPDVVAHVSDVLCHWAERGVDSWRLDAAYAVPPAFWRAATRRLREEHPHVWLCGEVLHGDRVAYVRESGLDSVTQYELWKAVWSSLVDRNLFELAHALGRHAELLPHFLPQVFVGNHDVTRLASRVEDPRHLPHAVAVLLTTPGVASVYYGDERAARGVKEDREGGDDAVRPALSGPAELTGGDEVWQAHRDLLALRKDRPWLAGATVRPPRTLTNTAAVWEVGDGSHTLTVALNLADEPLQVGAAGAVLAGTRADGRVPPHGWAVLG